MKIPVRPAAGTLCLLAGGTCLIAEVAWISAAEEVYFGLPPLAARALVFTVGLTGLVLIYAGYRMFRGS